MDNSKIQVLTGMHDILPAEAGIWRAFESAVAEVTREYGYEQIRTPLLEETRLFVRSIGEETDVVGKEMYTFDDNGTSVSLRPEGTASCLRAVIEANYLYDGPKKLWYMGPMFRHERPQKGRYRQFHQFGIEALGFEGPDIDVEIVAVGRALFRKLGFKDGDLSLEINSLGNKEERALYREKLVEYLKKHESILDEDSKRRMTTNPLRVLDTKNPELQEMCEKAPKLIESLGEESLAHYEEFKEYLTALGIAYVENPRLVRGLDYYNQTVFEWTTTELGSQATVLGGGRYNGLIGDLGGKDQPAIGFALGIERLLLLATQKGLINPSEEPDVYLMHQDGKTKMAAFQLAEKLREAGWTVLMHYGSKKLKNQFQKANQSGARWGVVVGESELEKGVAALKDLKGDKGQVEVAMGELPAFLKTWKS